MQKQSNSSTKCNSKRLAYERPAIDYSFPPPSATSSGAPFISILIPALNEHLVIDRLMRSCAALTYNQDYFEIIVVDDDSEDDTFNIVRKWTDKIPNLKVIRRSNR